MIPQRVVITGMGSISALGKNSAEFWSELSSGKSGIGPIKQVDCSDMRFKSGGEVKDYREADYFQPKQLIWLDRFAQFALIAAKEAVEDSKMNELDLANAKTAVITGSCVGGKNTEDQNYYRLYHQKKRSCHPNVVPSVMANAGASHIAATYGVTGPSYTLSTACSSSTHAIGHAFWLIRQGIVSRAITGGSEAPFSMGHLRAWEALRVVAPDTCRPFSNNRSGMIIGEGGAMFVLESLSSALERGASIHAEIVGFGMSADASHLTDPHSSGQSQAIFAALQDAQIKPADVHYINAHGTGTKANDHVESTTIRAVFPEADKHLLVSSTKAAHGHMLGATGATEMIATVLAIKHKLIPPTLNFVERDPGCDIPLVVNTPHPCEIDYALCSSFAFGGLNAILAVRRFQ